MLTERDLQELLDYKAQHPVLSIYLNTDPALGNADVYKLKLRSQIKEVDLPDDTSAIERYFDHEYDYSGRSVAVFSCAAEEFFRVYPIAMPVRSRVRVNSRPYVKPLADLLDSYGGYGVVIIDKQGARLFSFHIGTLLEQEGIMGESVRRVKHGGGSQAAGQRSGESGQTYYIEGVTDRNMKEAAEFASQFFSENNVRRVLIGGTDDNIALFRSQLPKSWQSLIVGTFPISMTASHTEVMERHAGGARGRTSTRSPFHRGRCHGGCQGAGRSGRPGQYTRRRPRGAGADPAYFRGFPRPRIPLPELRIRDCPRVGYLPILRQRCRENPRRGGTGSPQSAARRRRSRSAAR